jgi:hypothetical protein
MGSYGIFEGAKNIKDKLRIYKMEKSKGSKLLSSNTALISLNDLFVRSNGLNLSAQFHINRLKGKLPYVKERGRYVPAKNQVDGVEYFNKTQLRQINNLLNAIDEINNEIIRIKKSDSFDERIRDSKLSVRARNMCFRLIKSRNDGSSSPNSMLSDIAIIPVSEWSKNVGMGEKTLNEIKKYLTKKGFTLIKK